MNTEEFRNAATKQDIAKALLVTITNNIGSISLNAAICQVIENFDILYNSELVK